MKRFNILFLLLMLGTLTGHAQEWQPIQTRDGLVQGTFENGQKGFL